MDNDTLRHQECKKACLARPYEWVIIRTILSTQRKHYVLLGRSQVRFRIFY